MESSGGGSHSRGTAYSGPECAGRTLWEQQSKRYGHGNSPIHSGYKKKSCRMARVCEVGSGGGRGQRSRQEIGRPAEPVLRRQRRKCMYCILLCKQGVTKTVTVAVHPCALPCATWAGVPECVWPFWTSRFERRSRRGLEEEKQQDRRKAKKLMKREVEGGNRESRGLAVGMLWGFFFPFTLWRELVYKNQMRIIWDKMDDRGVVDEIVTRSGALKQVWDNRIGPWACVAFALRCVALRCVWFAPGG